jgi:glycerol uptake facilitator-like aquaporin
MTCPTYMRQVRCYYTYDPCVCSIGMCACVCVCVRACACVRACVCECVCECECVLIISCFQQPNKKKTFPLSESVVEFLIFGLISLALIPLSGVSSISAICVQ